MNLSTEDKRLLEELCEQHGVNPDKVVKLLDTVRDYEFKERRTGVYDALREILKSRRKERHDGRAEVDRYVKDPSLLMELCREVIDRLDAGIGQ